MGTPSGDQDDHFNQIPFRLREIIKSKELMKKGKPKAKKIKGEGSGSTRMDSLAPIPILSHQPQPTTDTPIPIDDNKCYKFKLKENNIYRTVIKSWRGKINEYIYIYIYIYK